MNTIPNSDDKNHTLKGMMQNMMEIFMEKERDEFLGYDKNQGLPPGSRRTNYRNGYREREFTSGMGTMESLKVPRDRLSEFFPELLNHFERRSDLVDDLIVSLYRKGMSQRDIAEVVEEIYEKKLSATTIGNVAKEVESERLAWEGRRLKARYTAIFIDCLHLKIRRTVVDTDAVYVAYAIDEAGRCSWYVGRSS